MQKQCLNQLWAAPRDWAGPEQPLALLGLWKCCTRRFWAVHLQGDTMGMLQEDRAGARGCGHPMGTEGWAHCPDPPPHDQHTRGALTMNTAPLGLGNPSEPSPDPKPALQLGGVAQQKHFNHWLTRLTSL